MDTAPVSTSSSTTSSVDGRVGAAGGSEFLNLGMFGSGQPLGVSEILLGSGGAFGGGTLGNGYGNDGSSGPTSSSTFDLNDFPSLGGGPPGSGAGTLSSTGSLSSTSGNGLAAALRQQQQLAHQQMLQVGAVNKNASAVTNSSNLYRLAMQAGANGVNANFNMATEDFPALPGPPPSSGNAGGSNGSILGPGISTLLMDGNGGSSLAAGNSFGGQSVSRGQSSGGASGSYVGDMDGGSNALDGNGLLGGVGLGGLGGLSGLSSMSVNPTALSHQLSGSAMSTATSGQCSGAANSAAGSALSGDYGLLGLLSLIRMTDADRNALALGSDLTMLGLNLNSTENLYSNFASPYSEVPSTKEPHYQLPMCYYMQPPALKTGHLSKFQLETLFYIFYALPKDVLQAYSAQELYTREWRYHAELKRWFKRATPQDGVTAIQNGVAQYLYFDINSWERRLFTGNMNQNITSGFLSEDDVRVKFPNS